MAKLEPNYFRRYFGDPNETHFRPMDVEPAIQNALQQVKATYPTRAITTVELVNVMLVNGFHMADLKEDEEYPFPYEKDAELGSWIEWKCEMGYQPYVAWGHLAKQVDHKGKKWSTREWFINAGATK